LAPARARTGLYHKQQTTPIREQSFRTEETITVIDPRHPLYGRSFPLIEISNKQYMGCCCVVSYRPSLARYIPLEATDRSLEPLVIEPLPLNLKAVQQLLTSYEKIVAQSVEGTEDEITKRGEDNCTSKSGRRAIRLSNGSGPDSTSASLASAEPGSTGTDFSASDADLPSVAQWSRSGGVGGER
jgi:hypothetical protein